MSIWQQLYTPTSSKHYYKQKQSEKLYDQTGIRTGDYTKYTTMIKLLCILSLLPLMTAAQQEDIGIKFETSLSWQQLLKKAKAENKFIFMDCYASWCIPCKKMDVEVFTNPEVAEFINNRFVAVKVQMDNTTSDSESANIQRKYSIQSFPTYLFLIPTEMLCIKPLAINRSRCSFQRQESLWILKHNFTRLLKNLLVEKWTQDDSNLLQSSIRR